VEKEGVIRLAGGLGDGQGGGVGEAVAGADDEALEGVVGVDGGLARRRAGVVVGDHPVLLDEADLLEWGVGANRAAEEVGVAALDPDADLLRRGQVKGRPAGGGDPQGIEPEAIGRVGERGPEVLADLPPGPGELFARRIWQLISNPGPPLLAFPGCPGARR
jgi:hypothetical protein